ncbi:hypothetical protein C0Q70_18612 [Pomacea canaliculata]|uniref:Uncharacterized protein n=1 Tax=Pomacea canaliculata TaxID=400727 RepID=A0A2T7NH25_POMCA|nr:hypothetical protein C0Q70_18612 [Pomacea canaliculata]
MDRPHPGWTSLMIKVPPVPVINKNERERLSITVVYVMGLMSELSAKITLHTTPTSAPHVGVVCSGVVCDSSYLKSCSYLEAKYRSLGGSYLKTLIYSLDGLRGAPRSAARSSGYGAGDQTRVGAALQWAGALPVGPGITC